MINIGTDNDMNKHLQLRDIEPSVQDQISFVNSNKSNESKQEPEIIRKTPSKEPIHKAKKIKKKNKSKTRKALKFDETERM